MSITKIILEVFSDSRMKKLLLLIALTFSANADMVCWDVGDMTICQDTNTGTETIIYR